MGRGAPIKTEYAKRLRRDATRGERNLWDQLASRQLGVKFRQQHPLYGYIADFYCVEFKLAVEVDGSWHDDRDRYDRMRDRHLADRGIKTVRIPDSLARGNPAAAAQLVRDALDDLGLSTDRQRTGVEATVRRRTALAVRARARREKQARQSVVVGNGDLP